MQFGAVRVSPPWSAILTGVVILGVLVGCGRSPTASTPTVSAPTSPPLRSPTAAEEPHLYTYGFGLNAGEQVAMFTNGASCGTTQVAPDGTWHLDMTRATCPKGPDQKVDLTFTINGHPARARLAPDMSQQSFPARALLAALPNRPDVGFRLLPDPTPGAPVEPAILVGDGLPPGAVLEVLVGGRSCALVEVGDLSRRGSWYLLLPVANPCVKVGEPLSFRVGGALVELDSRVVWAPNAYWSFTATQVEGTRFRFAAETD